MSRTDKRRHGCLTGYLYVFLALGVVDLAMQLFAPGSALRGVPGAPAWYGIFSLLVSALGIVWLVAVLRWRRWGFWGYIATSVASFAVNAAIGGPLLVMSIALVVGVALFVIVLQIGGANRGWPQLE